MIGAGKKSNCQAAAAERERVAAAAAAGVAISGGILSHQQFRVRREWSCVRADGGRGGGQDVTHIYHISPPTRGVGGPGAKTR